MDLGQLRDGHRWKKKRNNGNFLQFFSNSSHLWLGKKSAQNLLILVRFLAENCERKGVEMEAEAPTCWDPHPFPAREPPGAALWCQQWSSPSAPPGWAPLQWERRKKQGKMGKNREKSEIFLPETTQGVAWNSWQESWHSFLRYCWYSLNIPRIILRYLSNIPQIILRYSLAVP